MCGSQTLADFLFFKKRSTLPYGHQFSLLVSIPHLHIFQFHFWSCDNKQGFFPPRVLSE